MQTRKPPVSSRAYGRWEELFAQSDPRLLDAMEEFERAKTLGDRLADIVTEVAGSWWFVVSFMALMIVWVGLNALYLVHPFDAPPFVLLNLVLSTIAALQAPVILMSQSRQADRERLRAQHEYLMNLETSRQLHNVREEIAELRDEIRAIFKKSARD